MSIPSQDLVLSVGRAANVGMSAERLERAAAILEQKTANGTLSSASLLVARHGVIVLRRGWGTRWPGPQADPVSANTVFLIGSITKPIVVAALMRLVEAGEVKLTDPVRHHLHEFVGLDRDMMRVRDLLAHTSGLPDQLRENQELRKAHAPLKEFARHAMTTPLLYPPGKGFGYQSMGILLASEIVERRTGKRIRDVVQQEFFTPLGMADSELGLTKRPVHETAFVQGKFYIDDNADDEHCGMNSDYWRAIGNPWGGVHSTTGDLAIFVQMFLNGGIYSGRRYFSPETVEAMTTDQNREQRSPWGLGWALGRSPVWNYFGRQATERTFGHVGVQGNTAWAQPETGLLCILLTSRALTLDGGELVNDVSTAVQEASVSVPGE